MPDLDAAISLKKAIPHVKIHEVSEWHKESWRQEWVLIHDLIVASLSDQGITPEVVPAKTVPARNDQEIFFAKHGRFSTPNVWNIKKAYLPHYVYFDRSGYSGWAEVASRAHILPEILEYDSSLVEKFYENLEFETIGSNSSKIHQGSVSFDAPNSPFIFLPLQLSYDTVIQLSRIGFVELYETTRDLARNLGLTLVVKPHPFSARHPLYGRACEPTRHILQDAQQRSGVQITSASIHQILPECLAVFCINSGVGFEALIHLKPVYTAGHNDYHWATHPIASVDEINRIFDPSKPKLDATDTKRFLYYFLNEVLVDTRCPDRVRRMVTTALSEYRMSIGDDGHSG